MSIIRKKVMAVADKILEKYTEEELMKIADEIKAYFYNGKEYLEILDEGSNAARERGGYTGVRAQYVAKHVLQGKYPLDVVTALLLAFINTEDIDLIFCRDIGDIVFENISQGHIGYADYLDGGDWDDEDELDKIDSLLLILLKS